MGPGSWPDEQGISLLIINPQHLVGLYMEFDRLCSELCLVFISKHKHTEALTVYLADPSFTE